MQSEYGDYSADVVHNGIDHSQFYSPPRGKQPQPTVGLLHSALSLKGFDIAISVLEKVRERFPQLRVLAFGQHAPGGEVPNYVQFRQDPSSVELRAIYGSCDVWLTASRSEGFNLPAMEAMACRTPVVATRTGWPAEAVLAGYNGACVDVDDAVALARETERLLTLPDLEWRRYSENAFETVREMSWDRSVDLFERALQARVKRVAALPA
jgi:glycosyltransferase involved in cell wall biosynthesis